jgi:hypothetical protein
MAVGIFGLVVAAGCGGGDTTTAVTKIEFIKRANAVCRKAQTDRASEIAAYDKAIEAKGQEVESKPNLEKKTIAVLLPSMQKQLEELQSLDKPEVGKAQIEEMLEGLGQGVEKLEEEEFQGLSNAGKLEAFGREAQAFGLECSP